MEVGYLEEETTIFFFFFSCSRAKKAVRWIVQTNYDIIFWQSVRIPVLVNLAITAIVIAGIIVNGPIKKLNCLMPAKVTISYFLC